MLLLGLKNICMQFCKASHTLYCINPSENALGVKTYEPRNAFAIFQWKWCKLYICKKPENCYVGTSYCTATCK